MASTPTRSLEDLIRQLPEELRQEVWDFMEFLMSKRRAPQQPHGRLAMAWAGGLREYRDRFTSMELQQKASEWWAQDVRDEISR